MALVCERGVIVGARYKLDRLLGEGGMGAVWSATHLTTLKPVALKFLKGASATKESVRRRFVREARAASAVHHPNVVQIHDIFELDDGSPVMVMDMLVGESLAARLKRVGALPVAEVAAILVPVVSAVGTAHSVGIVHRDLKPDNIFLVELPEGKRDVRVLDFGIAKLTALDGDAAQTGALTHTNDMLGTPYYMAPEQATSEPDIDHRADIWALGIILYECLAGRRPIQGNNVYQILTQIMTGAIVPLAEAAPGVPPELTALVGTMLSRAKADRPADLRHVKAVLESFGDANALSFGEARPLPRRPGRQVLAVGGVVAALLAIALVVMWQLRRPAVVEKPPVVVPPILVQVPMPIPSPPDPDEPPGKRVEPPPTSKPSSRHGGHGKGGATASPSKEAVPTVKKEEPAVKEKDGVKRLPGGVPEQAPF